MDYLFEQFKNIKIGVVGDVMLDEYITGNVERISPEAPVPVLSVKKYEYRIGGAGNVAINLKALGIEVGLISVVGQDKSGDEFARLLEENNISTAYLVSSSERITTNKKRVLAHGQQMIRLDEEQTNDLSIREERDLLEKITTYIVNDKPALLILEDYNKGIFSVALIKQIIGICKKFGVSTAVDPKKKNFFLYQGVDIFKPNLKEISEAFNLDHFGVSLQHLNRLHEMLHAKLSHGISLITLSENGIFWNDNTKAGIIPSHIRQIRDVSGAGDTVIAVACAMYVATGGDAAFSATAANIAGGLVCEEVGTSVINKEKLAQELSIFSKEELFK